MESRGYQLEAVDPPRFPGPQRVCMKFCKATTPKPADVTIRGSDLRDEQLIAIIHDWPGARYYFYRR